MNKAEMAEMLKELTPQELRVLKYEVAGGHRCENTTSLYHCCNEARCEACHVLHLKAMHDEPTLWAYQKFVDKWQLTWAGYVPTKEKKKSAPRTKSVRQEPKAAMNAVSIADAVNDDNLEEVLALLARKLRKEI